MSTWRSRWMDYEVSEAEESRPDKTDETLNPPIDRPIDRPIDDATAERLLSLSEDERRAWWRVVGERVQSLR